MSTLTVQNIQGSSSSSNTISVASGHKISGASGAMAISGGVVQVLYTTYGTMVNSTATTYVDLCNIVITPKLAGSKFFLYAGFMTSGAGVLNLFRGSTQIHSHHATDPYTLWGYNQSAWNNNSPRMQTSQTHLDEPTYNLGDSITYHVKFRSRSSSGAGGMGINERTEGSTMSNFTVMEIAG
tara:strand:+ start:676 stop:1221 length:546 start_codon:yes stop_codon:yes gene_type:complete